MNPIDMLKTFASGGRNPQEIAMQLVGNNNNPMINNLVKMAQNGDYQGVENFARNMLKEQGRNFDDEMQQLQSIINNFK